MDPQKLKEIVPNTSYLMQQASEMPAMTCLGSAYLELKEILACLTDEQLSIIQKKLKPVMSQTAVSLKPIPDFTEDKARIAAIVATKGRRYTDGYQYSENRQEELPLEPVKPSPQVEEPEAVEPKKKKVVVDLASKWKLPSKKPKTVIDLASKWKLPSKK